MKRIAPGLLLLAALLGAAPADEPFVWFNSTRRILATSGVTHLDVRPLGGGVTLWTGRVVNIAGGADVRTPDGREPEIIDRDSTSTLYRTPVVVRGVAVFTDDNGRITLAIPEPAAFCRWYDREYALQHGGLRPVEGVEE